ncbi:MAG: hypothetical protein ACLUNZ_06620 [Evtepia sp.]
MENKGYVKAEKRSAAARQYTPLAHPRGRFLAGGQEPAPARPTRAA